ncbi:MAG: hypothetical protein ACRDHL_15700 [Candidatus Promineifilaceae bacterium]
MKRAHGEINTGSAVRAGLPAVMTSFIGRKDELAEIKRLLGSARLLTLTGAPGYGTTHLILLNSAEARPLLNPGAVWPEVDGRGSNLAAGALDAAVGRTIPSGNTPFWA